MSSAIAVQRMEAVKIPPELSGSVPRAVRLTHAGMTVVVLAVALAVGALASAIVMTAAYKQGEAHRQLREREAIRVNAEVVQVAVSRGEHPRRVVTYRYETGGRSYTGRMVLRERDRRSLASGASIPIAHLTSQPAMNWAIGYEPRGFPLWAIPLTSASLLLAASAVAWSVRRQWILLAEGRVALARITRHKRVHKDKHRAYRVTYEFDVLSGAKRTGRFDVGKAPPPVGIMIPVLYHRDRPQWSARYPLQFVQPSRAEPRTL